MGGPVWICLEDLTDRKSSQYKFVDIPKLRTRHKTCEPLRQTLNMRLVPPIQTHKTPQSLIFPHDIVSTCVHPHGVYVVTMLMQTRFQTSSELSKPCQTLLYQKEC